MGHSKSKKKVYLGALLAAFLVTAPTLSSATIISSFLAGFLTGAVTGSAATAATIAALDDLSLMSREAGHPEFRRGLRRFRRGDYVSAYNIWLPLAYQGNAAAQYYIGYMYLNGLYVNRDPVVARDWFERAAYLGNPVAQNDLATLYLNGQGVARNLDLALEWYRRAAEQGNPNAQYNLGTLYAARQEIEAARRWYRAAAMRGHARAQYYLSRLLAGLPLPPPVVPVPL